MGEGALGVGVVLVERSMPAALSFWLTGLRGFHRQNKTTKNATMSAIPRVVVPEYEDFFMEIETDKS
jgi:hypothetical protein